MHHDDEDFWRIAVQYILQNAPMNVVQHAQGVPFFHLQKWDIPTVYRNWGKSPNYSQKRRSRISMEEGVSWELFSTWVHKALLYIYCRHVMRIDIPVHRIGLCEKSLYREKQHLYPSNYKPTSPILSTCER